MKVALYARVSKDDGKQDSENQLLELRDFCKRQDWTVTEEYIDRMSGKTSERPRFQQMFTDASQRRFDLVLFWSLDRFSREGVLETLNHLKRLDSCGVNWRSFQESYFDSCGPFKDVVVSLMATLAKQERIRISERTKAGLARAKRAGKTLGRRRVEYDFDKLKALQEKGLSLRAIAEKTDLSFGVVARALRFELTA